MMNDSDFDACGFMPWIGPRYQAGFDGLRVLILGESHYRWPMDPGKVRQATRVVMQDEISRSDTHRFHSSVARVMLGANAAASQDDVVGFWESVAFYNYVQEFVGDHPRDRPSSVQWEHAGTVLPTVLATLRPNFVLACGRQLYEHLKTVPDLTSAPEFGTDDLTRSREIAWGTSERGVVGLIYHPASRGFRAAAWVPRVKEYLARAHALVGTVTSAPSKTT